MTTLSTLIGPGGSSLALGFSTPAKRSFWQRVGGVFRRKLKPAASAEKTAVAAPVEYAHQSYAAAPIVALSEELAAEMLTADLLTTDTLTAERSESADEQVSANMAHTETSIESIESASTGTEMLVSQISDGGPSNTPPTPPPNPSRGELLWGKPKREETLDEVRNGMAALAALLNGIQNHMERQGARQDELAERQKELIACLAHLPQASAAQTESLMAIRDQMAQGSANQARLCTALERLGGLQETTGEALTSIGRRIDQMDSRDAGFAASMEKVCDAMQTVSRASETGAVVLDRVQNALTAREDKMTRVIERQQTRFTALTAIAIAVSAAALAMVAGVGYLVLTRVH